MKGFSILLTTLFIVNVQLTSCATIGEEKLRKGFQDKDICKSSEFVFVLDHSSSLTASDFEQMKSFTTQLAAKISKIGNRNRWAVTIFDNTAHIEIECQYYNASGVESFTAKINSIGKDVGTRQTNIGDGLDSALKLMETQKCTLGRKDPKIIILVTDGKANEGLQGGDLIKRAKEIRDTGVDIFAIGVGRAKDWVELNGLAGSENRVIRLESFLKLITDDTIDVIFQKVCGIKKTTPAPTTTTTTIPVGPVGDQCSCVLKDCMSLKLESIMYNLGKLTGLKKLDEHLADITSLTNKISKFKESISVTQKEFETCKQKLNDLIVSKSQNVDRKKLLENYSKCDVLLNCKLAGWKKYLDTRMYVCGGKKKSEQEALKDVELGL